MKGPHTVLSSPLRRALDRARSAEPPGPVFTAAVPGSAPARPGGPIAVPPALDRPLALSLAGDRLRPVPSAGALHPVETRLLLGEGHAYGIAPGRYAYDPRRHRLHRLGPAPDPAPRNAFLVLGARPERTVSHYGHRGWPLVLLDVGHAAAGVVAAWPGPEPVEVALGTGPVGGMGFPLAGVRLAGSGGTGEWAGSGPPEPPAAGVPGDLAEAWRVLGELARAEDGGWSAPGAGRADPAPLLRRRSADPAGIGSGAPPPDPAALLRVLEAAETACRDRGPRWCLAVGGTRPGLLRSEHGAAVTLATGHVLPTLAAWAAGQGWIAGAGAVLLAYGCPSDAAPGRVRRDHLLAGYGVGHAQIEATALGLASRPVGSWQRADLGAALGGEPGREWILHGLALGSAFEAPSACRASAGHRRGSSRRGQEEDLQAHTPSPAGVPPAGSGGGPSVLSSVADGPPGLVARVGESPHRVGSPPGFAPAAVSPAGPGGVPSGMSALQFRSPSGAAGEVPGVWSAADGFPGSAVLAVVSPAVPGGVPSGMSAFQFRSPSGAAGEVPGVWSAADGFPGSAVLAVVSPAVPGGVPSGMSAFQFRSSSGAAGEVPGVWSAADGFPGSAVLAVVSPAVPGGVPSGMSAFQFRSSSGAAGEVPGVWSAADGFPGLAAGWGSTPTPSALPGAFGPGNPHPGRRPRGSTRPRQTLPPGRAAREPLTTGGRRHFQDTPPDAPRGPRPRRTDPHGRTTTGEETP
ncbi:hypothetical protein GCM10010232_37640 [Streptomyces amakusaensis]|uniref:Nitroreductase n=1 Tax=Streptomyces amakusaensis TaxID=67271 RepID=A0ABW0AF40_9ACTN